MKNLANCKPSEFLKQTYKIKKSVEKWIKDVDLMNIRKNMPVLPKVTKDMPEEEAERIKKENRNAIEKFAINKPFDVVFDSALRTSLPIKNVLLKSDILCPPVFFCL